MPSRSSRNSNSSSPCGPGGLLRPHQFPSPETPDRRILRRTLVRLVNTHRELRRENAFRYQFAPDALSRKLFNNSFPSSRATYAFDGRGAHNPFGSLLPAYIRLKVRKRRTSRKLKETLILSWFIRPTCPTCLTGRTEHREIKLAGQDSGG